MPRLEVARLSKSFGANRALADVSLTVRPGEIHALVGENGSGKSTLVKILSGVHAPNPGASVHIDGERLPLPVKPEHARRCGLSVVHQDLGLIDSFSVVENMRAGHFAAARLTRAIRWQAEHERARQSLASLGATSIDPDAPVAGLTTAERAEVAIARALQDHLPGRGLVIFDESTRALPPQPRSHFHTLTRGIARRGGAVMLISHQIEEVLAHADRVTVLRDGGVVGAGLPTDQISEQELIRLMLGRELSHRTPRRAAPRNEDDTPELEIGVRELHGGVLAGVSFTLRSGEVLGVTGLLGSGFEEIPHLLAGARRARSGTLALDGVEHDLAENCLRRLLEAGVALVPERRDREGLALTCSVMENVTLPRVRRRGRRAITGSEWQIRETRWAIETLGVRPADPRLQAGKLSGGNQQKVLLAKWLCGRPRLLLLHEPTQGVDVGARAEIERAVLDAADRGCAVILAGMDVGELAGVCDRVLAIADGLIAAELTGEIAPERIVEAVYAREERAGVAA